jgi:hypothetical protein
VAAVAVRSIETVLESFGKESRSRAELAKVSGYGTTAVNQAIQVLLVAGKIEPAGLVRRGKRGPEVELFKTVD